MLKSLSVNRNNLVPFRLTKQSCIGYSANFKGKETWLFFVHDDAKNALGIEN